MAAIKRTIYKAPIIPFILITSLFFMWGLANNMTDTLLAAFKKIMSLTDFQTSWIQMAFYGSYFCLALPAAIFIKKFTYKAGVLLGLGLFIGGAFLFYPSSITMNYFHFLIALYILAGGLSILETTANPYIIALGPEETGTQRLNFAQSFNPIGSITGVLLSKYFILSHLNSASAEERAVMGAEQLQAVQQQELSAVMGPYVGIALLLVVIWVMIAIRDMPKVSEKKVSIDLIPTLKRLFRKKQYVWGVVAQFFYVGAQIGVWSFTIRYVMQELAVDEAHASSYYLAALILFTAFRFVNTALMKYIAPGKLLTGSAILGSIATLIVIFGGGMIGVLALVSISAFMSLMFPTIYGLAVKGLDYDDTKIAGSGLIMAILGGAVLTAIQGKISDATGSIHLAYAVPLACFLLISFYGFFGFRRDLQKTS
ncbi:MAG: L-fucose:H+ symporter permease [Candidatus Marinimicrobia bacterium]|nr:L-fucose:H+ symporter permease [Candidatus Neomarinimicrobiota bacterium]MCF7828299.1 L-fucose:H+ symporter permease [Candidatus Neomarinimicrobiota bacterium]MCF7879526.1 L-fucose:H+ symporter permease [Candidatus Neomarinimicrobiota bacterium]